MLMSQSRMWPGFWRWAGLAVALSAGLLTGCATPTVEARVTSFQQWPADVVGQTYRFVDTHPGQADNLECQAYQDTMRAGIGPTGLVAAPEVTPARFTVTLKSGAEHTQVMEPRPYAPYCL